MKETSFKKRKIISWNVNGLRAVYKKNFLGWLKKMDADIVCLQEIKAQEGQVPADLINPEKYFSYFSFAAKKGYAGVAVYTKKKPLNIARSVGLERFDGEGRVLKMEYKDFILFNFYLPHGGRGKENLGYKLEVYDYLLGYFKKFKNKSVILIGDFNIAHEEIDLARPKANRDNIMFTSDERKRISCLIKMDFSDTFRMFHKDGGHYTWWPYFANARARNLGWRIDYAFSSKKLTPKIKNAFILKDVMGSDHCPIGIQF